MKEEEMASKYRPGQYWLEKETNTVHRLVRSNRIKGTKLSPSWKTKAVHSDGSMEKGGYIRECDIGEMLTKEDAIRIATNYQRKTLKSFFSD